MREIHTNQHVRSALLRIVVMLRSIYNSDIQSFISSIDNHPVIHTRMQALFNVKFNNELDKTLYELVINHATAAEKIGPGGFNRSLELLLEKFESGKRGNHHIKNNFARVATSEDLDVIIRKYSSIGNDMISPMIRTAIDLAGFGGKIIVEKTSSKTSSVELVRGYTFELQQFLPIDVSFMRPRIVCIDGYIEDVSEIHHFLEAASSAKEPCIVFLRGMSEDVKHTLKVNYDRGSLRVIPVGVRFDLEGMNILVDLSIVSGSDLVSSLKGDLISSIKFEDLPIIEQVTIFKGKVVINNSLTHKRVKQHIVELRNRREEEKIDDKGRLLDARIKSLSPNHVVIRLTNDKNFVINSQAIDYTLRAIRSTIDRGVTNEGLPVTTELAANLHANRCIETLEAIGAVLF